jgi:hypothetical protein
MYVYILTHTARTVRASSNGCEYHACESVCGGRGGGQDCGGPTDHRHQSPSLTESGRRVKADCTSVCVIISLSLHVRVWFCVAAVSFVSVSATTLWHKCKKITNLPSLSGRAKINLVRIGRGRPSWATAESDRKSFVAGTRGDIIWLNFCHSVSVQSKTTPVAVALKMRFGALRDMGGLGRLSSEKGVGKDSTYE